MSETETPPPPEQEVPPAEPQEGEQQRDEQGRFTSRVEKRIGYMRAQLTRTAQERDQLAQRIAALEARAAPQPEQQLDPQLQAAIDQRAAAIAEQRATQDRIAAFHRQGAELYPDWQQRCSDLQAMGADSQIAAMLVDAQDGHRLAAALHDDPESLERIAAIATERGRAVALGKFAAKLEAEPTRGTSKAPRPPAPLPSARATPAANPYLMKDTKELYAFFRAEEVAKQQKGQL